MLKRVYDEGSWSGCPKTQKLLTPSICVKNNIKKASVKFWEDLLYFQLLMQIFVSAPNAVTITTLTGLAKFDRVTLRQQVSFDVHHL